MIKKLDAKLALLATVVAALLVLMAGWFALISPERAKATHVDDQIVQQQAQLTAAQTLIRTTSKAAAESQLRAAERVLPDDPGMSQVLRQFSTASTSSKTQIDSVVPGAVTTVGTAQALPITLTLEGQYFGIRRFVQLLQARASMNDTKVVGKGRLYSVGSIQFQQTAQQTDTTSPSTGGSETQTSAANGVTATLNVYVYVAAPAAPVAPTPAPTDSSSTDTTTTATGATP
jgi:Tfp pilus assembly protein PilO